MERAIHTPFVPQGVPPVSKPFDLTAPKAVRPPSQRDSRAAKRCSERRIVHFSSVEFAVQEPRFFTAVAIDPEPGGGG